MTKQKIISVIVAIGAILIAIFSWGLYSRESVSQNETAKIAVVNPDEIRLVASKPELFMEYKDAVILPAQTIELTFSHALENVPEIRATINPEIKLKIELSDDRKTIKITGEKPFELGQGYTLLIKPDTKFEGKKTLGKDLEFHFSTISYKGV